MALAGIDPKPSHGSGVSMNIHERLLEVQGLLGRTMQNAQSPEERELFRVAAAALMFISETGTVHSFEDYLQTREEADAWLRQHPEPPHGAFVLIADEYHIVMHVREVNHRQLFPHPILDGYLEQLQQAPPPAALPFFETREDSEAWLKGQTEPLQSAFMMIAGRRHVALYHRNLNHYSIHLLPEPVPSRPG
jgi:hypothetical protein